IEAHYLASPFVKEICVLGLEGAAGTDRLHAVIVPNFDALRERKVVNTREVIRFDVEGLSAKLPSSKRISGYEIWQQDLPRTTTRKLKRFEIQKMLRMGKGAESERDVNVSKPLSAEETAWLENRDVQRALKIVREYTTTSPETLRPGDNLELDLGLDSMRRVELLVALEQELGGDVEESRLAGIYTLRELVDAITESAASERSTAAGGAKRPSFAGWSAVLREDPSDPAALGITKQRPILDRCIYLLTRLVKLVW